MIYDTRIKSFIESEILLVHLVLFLLPPPVLPLLLLLTVVAVSVDVLSSFLINKPVLMLTPSGLRGTYFCKFKMLINIQVSGTKLCYRMCSLRSPLLPQTAPPGRCDIPQRLEVYTTCTSCAAVATGGCLHGFSSVGTTNCRYSTYHTVVEIA